MTPADSHRAELRAAEAALDNLRAEMDSEVDRHGGHIPHDLAVGFAGKLEALNALIWELKGRLRTPTPAAG